MLEGFANNVHHPLMMVSKRPEHEEIRFIDPEVLKVKII